MGRKLAKIENVRENHLYP